MYKLHYFLGNESFAPHTIINEAGVQVELVLVDLTKNAQKSLEYLKINPAGRSPTLTDSDLALFESAAICMHLSDKQPRSQFGSAAGHPCPSKFL